jgi:uncharacterized protein GlcG (DUF336 family)
MMPGLIITLPLGKADAIVDAALAAGLENAMNPLTVVVLDAGGHLVTMKRADGSGIMRFEIAQGKAYGALGMGVPSGVLGSRLAERPAFLNALAAASNGRFIPVAGGVLVCQEDGAIIGAVGISGDTSEKDEYCGIYAVRSVGYSPLPANPAEKWKG